MAPEPSRRGPAQDALASDGPAWTCALCAGTRATATGLRPRSLYRTDARFEIVRCTQCGLLTTSPSPSLDELMTHYDSGSYYSTCEVSGDAMGGSGLLARLRRHVRGQVVRYYFGRTRAPTGAMAVLWAALARRRFGWTPPGLDGSRILDVGSGEGAFLLAVRQAAWEVTGLEISRQAALNAASMGVRLVVGELAEGVFASGSFDLVRLWSVLEHLRDPAAALREAARILRPGGWAIIQVPNAAGLAARLTGERWSGWDVPVHITHFTPATLRALVRANGLEPRELHHTSVGTLALSLGLSGVSPAGQLPRRNNMPAQALIALGDQLLDLVGLGDCVMLFAQKAGAEEHGA